MRARGRLLRSLLLLPLILSGGCYDRIELNALAVADLMAIDLSEDGLLRVSLQFVVPAELTNPGGTGPSGGQQDPFYTIEATGTTLPDAFAKIQAKLPRRLFTSHIATVILGEEFARAGIAPVFDSLTRMRELRITADVVATRGEGRALLAAAPRLGRLPSAALINLIYQQIVPPRNIREVAIALATEGIDPFLPLITLTSRTETELEQGRSAQEFEIGGIAAFRGDRLVGFASLSEARGLAWLIDKAPFATATIEWPPPGEEHDSPVKPSDLSPVERLIDADAPPGEGPGRPGGGLREPNQISPMVIRGRVDLHPRVEDGKIRIEVRARVTDDIVTNQAGLDFTDPAVVPALEKALAEDLTRRMRTMLQLAQEVFQADLFGFGLLLRRSHPQVWQQVKSDWHALFSQLEVDIEVKPRIRRVGLTNSPAPLVEEQLRKVPHP